jgi:tetratricopeptide (TPR) repeat protein
METIQQRLTHAIAIHEAGRREEAAAIYRSVLAEDPKHPHALHLLGLVTHQEGRFQEAADLIHRALEVHGPHPVFHSNLAAVYLELDRLDDTIAHAREAIRLAPGLGNAHNNLGVALMRQGRYDEAVPAFVAAIRLHPGQIDVRSNLGSVFLRQGRLPEAIACLREAVRLAPNHAQAQNDLGGALLADDQYAEAMEHFQIAIRLRPNFAEAHSNLGLAYRELSRPDEAMACFRESLRLNPNYAPAYNNIGYTLEYKGQIDAAKGEFLRALEIDPNNPRALASLTALALNGHYELEDDQITRMKAILTRHDVPQDDLCRINFGVARSYANSGDHDLAFKHYREGNELRKAVVRRRAPDFDPRRHHWLMDRLLGFYRKPYFDRIQGFGSQSELPIFIVGMMRSGTTLTEQILSSHPRVFGAGELRDIGMLTESLSACIGTAEPYPGCLDFLDAATASRLGEEHVGHLRELGGTADRVVDKMPFNYLNLGLIATLLPRARIIHCRRDPVDTCLSCYFQNFSEPQGFTLDLAYLGMYYREYLRVMKHWREVLPMPIFELQYEELIADPEPMCRRLLEFCGLEWDERCLRFHETERPVRTASLLQVRKPLYTTAVRRWKRYEKHLGPLIEALGEDAGL